MPSAEGTVHRHLRGWRPGRGAPTADIKGRRPAALCPRPAPHHTSPHNRVFAQVNAIRWDPEGRLLASCSDDNTAKVWSVDQDEPLHSLGEHSKQVYCVRWRPAGRGSANPSLAPLLATASFDATVKLWDTESGRYVAQCCSRGGYGRASSACCSACVGLWACFGDIRCGVAEGKLTGLSLPWSAHCAGS